MMPNENAIIDHDPVCQSAHVCKMNTLKQVFANENYGYFQCSHVHEHNVYGDVVYSPVHIHDPPHIVQLYRLRKCDSHFIYIR